MGKKKKKNIFPAKSLALLSSPSPENAQAEHPSGDQTPLESHFKLEPRPPGGHFACFCADFVQFVAVLPPVSAFVMMHSGTGQGLQSGRKHWMFSGGVFQAALG